MEPLKLEVPGVPLVWKAPYVGSHGTFSPRYKEKQLLQWTMKTLYNGPLIKDILIVDLEFYIPIPKHTSLKKRSLMIQGQLRPTFGGDRINLAKFAEDCLQGVVIQNDRQIVGGYVEKWYSENPRTIILIKGAYG